MGLLADLSIRNKLLLIISSAAIFTVVVGFATIIARERRTLKHEMEAQTELIAELAGDYSAGELAFDDPEASQESLAKLALVGDIDCARLFDADGRPFAAFERLAEPPPAPAFGPRTAIYGGDHLFVEKPITYRGEPYGTIVLCASTAQLDRRLRRSLLTLSGLVAGLALLSVLVASRLQRVISRPILALAEVAQRVSTSQDYSIRARSPGSDEIGVLYEAWNDMLSRIERRDREGRRYADALERSNRELDQFAYIVSHDLKAPLRAIVNLSEWIEEDLEGQLSGGVHKNLLLLRSRTRRMEGLIDGILEYSRLIRVQTEEEEVDVGRLLRQTVLDLQPPAGFRVVIAAPMPVLFTSKVRLGQVFANLIGNAIKHSRRDAGRVEVSVRDRGEVWEFAVADDGPGIPADSHDKIFRIFQTLQPRDTFESTGIGLSLVQKIIEEQGGWIGVDSEEGRGATFRFTWPKTRPRGEAAAG